MDMKKTRGTKESNGSTGTKTVPAEPIAIVGIGCRFPGGLDTPSKLWKELKHPGELATGIPKSRWSLDRFYHPVGRHHGTTPVRESYFLNGDVRHFDHAFFNVSVPEAEAMDPQHRMLLEVVYEALDSGGISLASLQGSDTAAYVGLMCTDYYATSGLESNFIPKYAVTGIAASNASSRLSYHFDWHGPSMTIDTACSSSLVALHHAVDQLRLRRSKVAVAAGANLLLSPQTYITESNLNMLSATSRSRMWDADADGYARGDGIAALVLKRLSDAIADGDHIEGVIRETAIGHDGRTKGITMPSGVAQADLIRATYAQAGLDPRVDRPQFFEAHGTGTPVGDPQEASALAAAFFDDNNKDTASEMLVGSIKTIIGHTEGTAGLAGVIKACLALKHAQVPPNLLFNKLSPAVEPYYKGLRIPTKLTAWPEVPAGQPRRASVNSFGFGGTNSHCILESFEPSLPAVTASDSASGAPAVLPLTFSAASESSLVAQLSQWETFLSSDQAKEPEALSIGDLGYTLTCKKSAFPYKVALTATSSDALRDSIKSVIDEIKTGGRKIQRGSTQPATSYLGIFTGQGAQWPRMGYELVMASKTASTILDTLDEALATLPAADRPGSTLRDELFAPPESSRVSLAEVSQPICTAVQIILVDLLRAAGIRFSCVVGHSSGEIGAAYAAGFLKATDAIRLAYYRGLLTTRHAGRDPATGEKLEGAMIAVQTTLEDAKALCESEDLKGRIAIAAINSATSLTLSGDAEAIRLAKIVFDEESKFNRVLRVDMAYHSHHMMSCASQYAKAMIDVGIEILTPAADAPRWFSSVNDGELVSPGFQCGLESEYWVQNMTGTVFFEKALSCALDPATRHAAVDVIVEVGPHPALKGPASDVIQVALPGSEMPYLSTLERGKTGVASMAQMLGDLWTARGPASADFKGYQVSFGGAPSMLLENLPSYAWDYDKSLWAEPRTTRNYMRDKEAFHDLLGMKIPEGNDSEWHWSNQLREDELEWLSDHSLQGQVIFPATGYVAMAIEASMRVAKGATVKLVELHDVAISRAMAIPSSGGVETVVSMINVRRTKSDSKDAIIDADFACCTPLSRDSADVVPNCTARVVITLGEGGDQAGVLAPRSTPPVGLQGLGIEDFYQAMDNLGYYYDGPFRSITKLSRKLDTSSGLLQKPQQEPEETPLLLHPGMLDSMLQALFAAFSYPGDRRLWALHAPTHIRRLSVVPSLCGAALTEEVEFDCFCTDTEQRNRIVGDIDLYTYSPGAEKQEQQKFLEIDGLVLVPLSPFSKTDDITLFANTLWFADSPSGPATQALIPAPPGPGKQKALDLERVCFYYMRKALKALQTELDEGRGLAPHRQACMNWIVHEHELVTNGEHPFIEKAWLQDEESAVVPILEHYIDNAVEREDADFALVRAVGENLPDVIAQGAEGNIYPFMLANNALDRYYEEGMGLQHCQAWAADAAKQIAERYPQMHIVEIGAGTGGTTKRILPTLGHSFASYTFTDVSPAFLERARLRLEEFADRMEYRKFDMNADPATQGFKAGAYDLAVAANVLHATPDMPKVMRHTRSLLKPGGYLILVEHVENSTVRTGFTQSGLPGWWCGVDSGRPWGPTLTLPQWDELLKSHGFAGIETSTTPDALVYPGAMVVAQAVDDDFRLLRQPLEYASPESFVVDDLVLVGTGGPVASGLARDVRSLLEPRQVFKNIHVFPTLEELADSAVTLPANCTTLGLGELDSAIFKSLTPQSWEGLKRVVKTSDSLLWLTQGATSGIEPYAAISIGLFRSIFYEFSNSDFQLLDVDDATTLPAKVIAETLLKLEAYRSLRDKDKKTQRKDESDGPKRLWSQESDLVWDAKASTLKIMRIKPDQDINDRYNSQYRRITKPITRPGMESSLDWKPKTGTWLLQEVLYQTQDPTPAPSSSDVALATQYSVLSSIQTSAGRLFLALGEESSTGTRHMCLTPNQSSKVVTSSTHAVPVSVPRGMEQVYLSYVTVYLFCHSIFATLPATSNQTIVINEPHAAFASILAAKAAARGVRVLFTTADPFRAGKTNWIQLHPMAPERTMQAAIPRDVVAFYNMGADDADKALSQRIQLSLPQQCSRFDLDLFLSPYSRPQASDAAPAQLLGEANAFAMSLLYDIPDSMPIPIVTAKEISHEPSSFSDPTDLKIVDWVSAPAAVEIEPVDRRADLQFRGDVTYWLLGMAGDMGQSICDWMAKHGARHVVLSSRNPQLPAEWLAMHQRNGVHVAGIKADVTEYADLERAKAEILHVKGFPRVAGVANGALVLRDRPLLNTDYDMVCEVLKPKVDGTVNLDRLFEGEDLDFFIALSSFVATIGNPGQTVYCAANNFQKALVRQRHDVRGLAGSSIDISSVLGVGYVTREKQTGKLSDYAAERLLKRSGIVPLSEVGVQLLFAEGILAGRKASSSQGFNIVSGLQTMTTEQAIQSWWGANPRASQLIRNIGQGKAVGLEDDGGAAAAARLPLKTRLEAAKSAEDAFAIVKDAFMAKLRSSLYNHSLSEDVPLVNLGVDSLVAVVMRNWAKAEVGVDLPALKILGGDTSLEIIAFLTEKLDFGSDSSETQSSSDDEVKSVSTDTTSVEGEGASK